MAQVYAKIILFFAHKSTSQPGVHNSCAWMEGHCAIAFCPRSVVLFCDHCTVLYCSVCGSHGTNRTPFICRFCDEALENIPMPNNAAASSHTVTLCVECGKPQRECQCEKPPVQTQDIKECPEVD
jgi:hypothetical protein